MYSRHGHSFNGPGLNGTFDSSDGEALGNIPCFSNSSSEALARARKFETVKRSVLTTGTWMVLIGAAVLVAAGFLNFAQRSRRETPAWDGVRWVDTQQGILAETVEPNSSGSSSLDSARATD